MTAQKKNYTNADIIKRLDTMDGKYDKMNGRVGVIENKLDRQEWAQEAIAEYRRQESSDKVSKGRDNMYGIIRDAGPWVLVILASLAAIIYAYAQRAHT